MNKQLNSDKLISVIVPVFNAGKRIRLCVDSILCQTYKNIELLLIDDGSSDNSLEICNEYAKSDERIVVLHKENGGVSSARNFGLSKATGEYISFVDSDDTIDDSFIENAISDIETYKTDAYYSGLIMEYWQEDVFAKQEKYTFNDCGIVSVKGLMETLEIKYPLICICGPCCKLYKKSIIDNADLKFDCSMSLGEDTMFNIAYLEKCKNIYISSNAQYHYFRGNPNSLFSKCHIDTYELHTKIYDKMRDLMVILNCSSESIEKFNVIYVRLLVGCIHSFFQNNLERSQKQRLIGNISNNVFLRKCQIKYLTNKEKAIVILLKTKLLFMVYLIFKCHYSKNK